MIHREVATRLSCLAKNALIIATAICRGEYGRRAGSDVWLDETFNALACNRPGCRNLRASALRAFRTVCENWRRAHKLPCICTHGLRLGNSCCTAWYLGFDDGDCPWN